MATSKQALRQLFRQARRQLSPSQQQQAAEQLRDQVSSAQLFAGVKHVAMYLSNDGELACEPLIHWCWQRQIAVYLPVLHPLSAKSLIFLRYCAGTPLRPNRFGIAEPKLDVTQLQPLANIDVVLMPLVAFDLNGNRLGMGGGFYDRTLAASRRATNSSAPAPAAPALYGLAHNCQQSEQLLVEPWDIGVNKILTPERIISIA